MAEIVLVPWPETPWSAAGRLAGRTPLPLTESGLQQACAWADVMAGQGPITSAFSSGEQTSTQTARVIADRCDARHRLMADLVEVDAGLWEGLTADELNRRYPKVFKRWRDDPSSVCPPEGEELGEAHDRVKLALDRLVRKYSGRGMAVVLGPLAFALARCVVESVDPSQVRSLERSEPVRYKLVDNAVEASAAVLVERLGVAGSVEPAIQPDTGHH